jgi:hypothetical protein
MSTFNTTFKLKKTGDIYLVNCRDDFFGRHRYGYIILEGKDVDKFKDKVFTEDEFQNQFEWIKTDESN